MTRKYKTDNAMPKLNIKKQLLYIFLLVIFLPLFTIGIYSIHVAKGQMTANYEGQVSSETIRIKSILFDITTLIYNFSDNITNSRRYTSLFSTQNFVENKNDYNAITDFVENYCSNTTSITSVNIYTTNQNLPENSVIKPLVNYENESWYEDSLKSEWDTWETVYVKDTFGNETPTLTLVRRLVLTKSQYSAYLVICVNMNYIKNRLSITDYQVFCSVNDSAPFISPNRSWMHQPMPFPESNPAQGYFSYTGAILLNGAKILTNISTFHPYKTNDSFYIIAGNDTAYHDINRILVTYIFILIASVFFPGIIIYCFSSRFDKRLTILKNAMHQVRLGDYNIIQNFRGDDELKEIFVDLQSTVKHIYETEAQFYQSQITRQQLINNQQKMEFQLLASQINPHFLYNTLEMIRMQALSCGNRDVAHSVELLGNSMHYVLENTGTNSISLETEIEYLNTYLSIQKLRFGNRIDYDIICEPDIDPKTQKIIPFLLQPIVENSISHGLDKRANGGYISIYIFSEEDILTIQIADNGCGMSSEKLAEVMTSIQTKTMEERSGSIGLFNIYQRISLLYGSPYKMSLESTLNEGTTVTITLPTHSVNTNTDSNESLGGF